MIKIKNKNLEYWEAVAIIVGTIIGAGVLGIPFAINKVGMGWGFLMLIILGAASALINLMVAEIALRTDHTHQLAGLAGQYLGKGAKYFEIFAMVGGSYGALLAYIIGEGQALSALFGGNPVIFSLAFFIIAATVLYLGLKVIKVFELWMVATLIIVMTVIFLMSAGRLQPTHFAAGDWREFLLPYGVILFAFSGASSVVHARRILINQKTSLKKAVITASSIPFVIYTLFALLVIGATGAATTEVATIGLGRVIGPSMVIFGNLFAIFAMGTSFLTLGLGMRELYEFDLGIKKKLINWLMVVSVPLILFLFGARHFVVVLGTVGALSFGITGMIIINTYWRSKRRGDRQPEFAMPKFKLVGLALILMFALGIIYSVVELIR